MARRKRTPETETVDPRVDLNRRRQVLQRVLLESTSTDSDARSRHDDRLRKVYARGDDPAERVAVYEQTIEELGLTHRYHELMKRPGPYGTGQPRQPGAGRDT